MNNLVLADFFSEKKCELKFNFEKLEDFKWFEVIDQNLLTTIAFIAVIAGISFTLSRAFKKNLNRNCSNLARYDVRFLYLPRRN